MQSRFSSNQETVPLKFFCEKKTPHAIVEQKQKFEYIVAILSQQTPVATRPNER
jgi:hypothetical protein